MCNAYNHPRWCMCGFGGFGYGGGDGGLGSVWKHYAGKRDVCATYVNSNAKCPECGDPVFFYQSPDGGRVFFDDVGPPWPKHPCTDSASPRPRRSVAIRADVLLDKSLFEVGAGGSWRPFVTEYLGPLPGDQIRIHGQFYWHDGKPRGTAWFDTVGLTRARKDDIEAFHHHAAGLPLFVRPHDLSDYYELAELDLLVIHPQPHLTRARKTEPVTCTTTCRHMPPIRRQLWSF